MTRSGERFDPVTVVVRVLAALVLISVWGVVITREAPAQDEPDRDYWVNRYETLRTEVEDLRTRVDMLQTQYSKAKRRNYPRGAQLDELRISLEKSRTELAAKEEELENFPDEARRAGAPPGWFRD